MNIFAGLIHLKNPFIYDDISLDYDFIEITKTSFFVMGGEEEYSSSEEIIEILEKEFGELEGYSLSVDSEDKIEILSEETSGNIYENVCFRGANIDFETIVNRFADNTDVICVREGAESNFGNRIIEVDFLY